MEDHHPSSVRYYQTLSKDYSVQLFCGLLIVDSTTHKSVQPDSPKPRLLLYT